jgi:Flp pilus assembly protein TadG
VHSTPSAAEAPGRRGGDEGAAVVDFVLVMTLLVPLVLGILQVGLVLHVRNTLTSAASEGARVAGTYDREPSDGAARTRELITGSLSGRYASDVTAARTGADGYAGVEVVVRASVPALGLFGPTVDLEVSGHSVEETLP